MDDPSVARVHPSAGSLRAGEANAPDAEAALAGSAARGGPVADGRTSETSAGAADGTDGHIQRLLGERRFAEALARARATGPEQMASCERVFESWIASAPVDALRAAAASDDDAALAGVLRVGAGRCPDTLAEAACQLTHPRVQALVWSATLPRWAERDPVRFARWVMALPRGEALDAAVEALLDLPGLAERFPDVATMWARDVSRADLRRRVEGLAASR